MLRGLAIGAMCFVVAGTAAATRAQTPDPTLLVLQPADVPASFRVTTAPRLTTSDGDLSATNPTYRRLSGAEASYARTLIGGSSVSVASRAVIFRDATGAHGAYLAVVEGLGRKLNSTGSDAAVGQESRRFNVLVLGDYVVWRHGNVVAQIHTSGRGPGSEAIDYTRLQQNRIAALVAPADPSPSTVKPVIGTAKAQPARPSAGKRFTVRFPVSWSDDGSAVTSASVATRASVASKAVPHRYSFGAGRLTISMTVPRTAKGKQLRLTATLRAENRVTTKSVAYKVR